MKKIMVRFSLFMCCEFAILGGTLLSSAQVKADMVNMTLEAGGYKSSEKKTGIVDEYYDNEKGVYQLHPIIYNEKGEPETARMGGNMFATLDGIAKVPLYWSEITYKDMDGKNQYMGVLKPQDGQGWTEQSCVIWKPKFEPQEFWVYALASKQGPRDLKVEYSLDGGETFVLFPNGTVTLKQVEQEQNIFENITILGETLWEIRKAIHNQQCYIRISTASDVKLDGSIGLYGSQEGELVLSQLSSHMWVYICVPPPMPPEIAKLSVHKIGDKKAKISWQNTRGRAEKYEIYQKRLGNTLSGKSNIIVKEIFKKIHTIKVHNTGTMDDFDKKYSFTVKNLNKKGKYVFYVKAVYDEFRTVKSDKILLNMKTELLPKDIKLAKKVILKKGSRRKIPFTYKKGTKKSFVSKVDCTVQKRKIALFKKGKILAKRRGSTKLTVKVTLKSGLKRTFKTKVVVK